MSRIGHAEAHERLADLALEPAALAALADAVEGRAEGRRLASVDDEVLALAEHVSTCPRCRVQLDGWRATHRGLELATAGSEGEKTLVRLDDLAHDPVIPTPAGLRDRVLAIGATERGAAGRTVDGARAAPRGRAGGPVGPLDVPAALPTSPTDREARLRALPTILVRRILPIAAAVAILVGAVAFQQQTTRLDSARSEVVALEGVTAVLDRLLRAPDHHVVALVGADGTARGSLAWSSRDLVVMTTALDRPAAGETYRCWVERDGVRTPVGEMWFAGRLAYWTGSLDEWATISLDRAGRFGVSLVSDSKGPTGDPVLVATLPG